MPTYFIIDGVKIEFYYKDHNPPYFHAIIAEYDALVEIKTKLYWKEDYLIKRKVDN